MLGETHEQKWGADIAGVNYQLAPKFDGNIWGVQAGIDLYSAQNDWGQDRFGVFYTHTAANGSVYGDTLAIDDDRSGNLSLQGDNVGGYWTHIGQSGWYVDTVLMHTWLYGNATSVDAMGARTDGDTLAISLEGGVPFQISENWTLEPQGQIIWQHINLENTSDAFSTIDYHNFDPVTGRIGGRLENNTSIYDMPVQPFISLDLWHNFSQTANAMFDGTDVATGLEGTSLEAQAGASLTLMDNVAAYGAASYTTNLGGQMQRSIGGNIGIRIRW